ncbi:MAG: hypothetical protein AMXMBFR13_03320 [Phycisphaerae bacterium]
MNLLILHAGAIGDFVLTLSVIQALRASLAADRVVVIASAASARLSAGRSAVDVYLPPESVGLHLLFQKGNELDRRLAEPLESSGTVLNFFCGPGEPLDKRLRQLTPSRVISVDPRPSASTLARRQHITAQWAQAVRDQGGTIGEPAPPRISVTPRALAEGGAAANISSKPVPPSLRRVVIHPGSGGQAKCWPLERFAALADALENAAIQWMLGPVELESRTRRFAVINERVRIRGEQLLIEKDLTPAARHIASANLFIGNDAGMTHVAAALGTRTVAIFGPTDPDVWRPVGGHVLTAAPASPGPIESVSVEEVLAACQAAEFV